MFFWESKLRNIFLNKFVITNDGQKPSTIFHILMLEASCNSLGWGDGGLLSNVLGLASVKSVVGERSKSLSKTANIAKIHVFGVPLFPKTEQAIAVSLALYYSSCTAGGMNWKIFLGYFTYTSPIIHCSGRYLAIQKKRNHTIINSVKQPFTGRVNTSVSITERSSTEGRNYRFSLLQVLMKSETYRSIYFIILVSDYKLYLFIGGSNISNSQ